MPQNPFGGTGTDTASLPNKVGGGGIRANTTCPTCWDGVNLESADHKSHVAYPSSDSYESIYSMGDGTGYGWHGDYLCGWKATVLQVAVDERCSGNARKGMKTQLLLRPTPACSRSRTSTRQPQDGFPAFLVT
ncbi:hypothetical protein BGZ57DRAFT_1009383 [Hyaloscypha finlandica]|nr:hypothetical protein BGZ57DRAFT_1009383 [Hyaloscypha finlandica]